eukprot:365666-Chlamydomonas_euryale.AAC.8
MAVASVDKPSLRLYMCACCMLHGRPMPMPGSCMHGLGVWKAHAQADAATAPQLLTFPNGSGMNGAVSSCRHFPSTMNLYWWYLVGVPCMQRGFTPRAQAAHPRVFRAGVQGTRQERHVTVHASLVLADSNKISGCAVADRAVHAYISGAVVGTGRTKTLVTPRSNKHSPRWQMHDHSKESRRIIHRGHGHGLHPSREGPAKVHLRQDVERGQDTRMLALSQHCMQKINRR